MQLFDDFTRTRATIKGEAESDFHFLNTSAFRFVDQVRAYLQEWFDRYPEKAKPEMYSSFASDDDHQHTSAHFELFLHELLLRLGFAIEVHPSIEGVAKRPDFRIRHEDTYCYLEAVVINTSSANRIVTQHERLLMDWLNELDGSNFWLRLEVNGTLRIQPRKKNLNPVRSLLARNDPDEVESIVSTSGYDFAPHANVRIGDWSLRASLIPRPASLRGNPEESTFGMGPGAGGVTDTTAVAEGIADKATEKKSSQLDAPLVIAAKTMDAFYDVHENAVPTMLGWPQSTDPFTVAIGSKRQAPGVWLGRNGQPQYRNLHAVWIFESMPTCSPSPTAQLDSALVINPTVAVNLPWPLYRLSNFLEESGKMRRASGVDLNNLLEFEELPRDLWDQLV